MTSTHTPERLSLYSTRFGRWPRRAGPVLVPFLDKLLWYVLRRRRAAGGGAPKTETLILDSMVSVGY